MFGTDEEIDALAAKGYELGVTLEGPKTWRTRTRARATAIRKEQRAAVAATGKPTSADLPDAQAEIVVLRADYFENYAGRFLSVEAKTRAASVNPATGAYTGPALSLSWNEGDGTAIAATPRPMNVNIDTDATPDTYIEHRELVRIGGAASTNDVGTPTRIRIGSSTGATMDADVDPWLAGGLPPMAEGRLKDFTTRYLDPTELYGRFRGAGRGVPEPLGARDAAQQDERLPAACAGDHVRHDRARRQPPEQPGGPGGGDAGRGPHLARVGP